MFGIKLLEELHPQATHIIMSHLEKNQVKKVEKSWKYIIAE